MKLILTFLLCPILGAATLHEQLTDIVRKADRVELTWRSGLGVERAGVVPLKRVYAGRAIDELLAHIKFVEDQKKGRELYAQSDPSLVKIPNCRCIGSHLLRFIAHSQVIVEVSLHHGLLLRSELLNSGRDARLTKASQEWLQAQADWDADMAKIDSYARQRKGPNKTPEPTPQNGVAQH